MQLCFDSDTQKKEVTNKDTFILSCTFPHVVNLSWCSLCLHVKFSYCLVSFYFSLKDSHEHLLEGTSANDELPQFLLSGNVFISLSCLKDCVAR